MLKTYADPFLAALSERAKAFEPVGSRVTVSPSPAGTDADYLMLVGWFSFAEWHLRQAGYRSETQNYGTMLNFRSWRKGSINVIITYRRQFFDAFMAATHVAKRLNLREKADRVALFQAVLYRNKWNS